MGINSLHESSRSQEPTLMFLIARSGLHLQFILYSCLEHRLCKNALWQSYGIGDLVMQAVLIHLHELHLLNASLELYYLDDELSGDKMFICLSYILIIFFFTKMFVEPVFYQIDLC